MCFSPACVLSAICRVKHYYVFIALRLGDIFGMIVPIVPIFVYLWQWTGGSLSCVPFPLFALVCFCVCTYAQSSSLTPNGVVENTFIHSFIHSFSRSAAITVPDVSARVAQRLMRDLCFWR